MLDDLKFIHEKDIHDALGAAEKQWQQLEHVFELGDWQPKTKISNVVHSGMGGSALWAFLSLGWPGYTLPFEIVRDYHAPHYVDEQTLFIASSYSGNTEETLSSLLEAEAKGAQIVVITSGGKLETIAKEKGYLLLELPKIDKPRYGTMYGLKGLLTLGEHLGILAQDNVVGQLESSAAFLKETIAEWSPTVATKDNLAKELALDTIGKSPVIYAGSLLAPAAHKWKISFNENSKNIAWEYSFPEFNHNEFTGWTSHPVDKPYAVFYLRSSFDHDRVVRRFELSNKFLSGRWPEPVQIQSKGETQLEHLLYASALGEFTSLYTGLLNGVSPIDVGDKDIIEKFKKELGGYEHHAR